MKPQEEALAWARRISFEGSEIGRSSLQSIDKKAWEWPDFIQSPGDVPVDRQGIITMVMIKRLGKWRSRASQNPRIWWSDVERL